MSTSRLDLPSPDTTPGTPALGVARISVVVPCYNERPNVRPLVAGLDAALAGLAWEVIFVDDNSPDGTSDEIRALAAVDPRVRGLRRVGRRGLSTAVIEGVLASSAPLVAVMDGDLQHDETRLVPMLEAVEQGLCDIAVGSRHVAGGDASGLASAWRHRLSEAGIGIARRLLPVRLGFAPLGDPMSGFFAFDRRLFEQVAPRLSGKGFKILLDLILSAPEAPRVLEIPARFRPRLAGESKLDVLVLVQFAAMLLDKACRGYLPVRFIAFALVGCAGVLVNLAVLDLAGRAGAGFATSQTLGTIVAMVVNFWLNNSLTYRDRRLRGAAMWRGLALFMLVCSAGGIANIGIARTLHHDHHNWQPAGAAGAAIGVVWNYAVSSTLIWRLR